MSYLFRRATMLNNILMKFYIHSGMKVIDATIGNGNDTEFLLNNVGKSGFVYGFDIQEEAIKNTENRIKKFDNYKLYKDSHENLDKYFENESIDFIIYNFGYLPKYDKKIMTKARTSLKSVKKSLEILKSNGILSLVFYPGHEEGEKEYKLIREYLTTLDQKKYNVLETDFINQINNPPILIVVEKK